ncbi:MAG: YbaB/EbfC family nucleoid-associated protein [Chitinophagaceae bacterium]|nr:YbaB/EbfC family nucleoid-associated protein [Chitinophagaceae bacterium]
MLPQQLKEAKEKFLQLQKNIQETVTSAKGEITVVFDGNAQITKLVILNDIDNTILEPLLVETINRGIKNVSIKIQNVMVQMQQQMKNTGMQ